MQNQEERAHVPAFRPDPDPDHEELKAFVRAMFAAHQTRASIQHFQQILREAPVVPAHVLSRLTSMLMREFQVRPDVLRLLIAHEPEIAKHGYHHGNLLLHTAIMSEAPVEMIQLLLDTYPDGIYERCRNGFLPFHLACEYNMPEEVFDLLLSRYPNAIRMSVERWHGDLSLHMALGFGIDVIHPLINAYPEAVSIITRDGETALHIACSMMYPFDILERLFQLYPEALSIQDANGNLPLHIACQRRPPDFNEIKLFIDKYPEGIRSKGHYGQLPLHCALLSDEETLEKGETPVDMVRYFIETYPAAVSVTDERGNLPLHKACSAGVSHEVILLLLDCYNGEERHCNGLKVANADGRFPLHCYSSSQGTSDENLQHLLQLHPEGIHVQDRNGMLPLHNACSIARPVLGNIRLLVEAAPFNIVQKTRDGRTPYQLARGIRDRNAEVETYLVEKQNEVVAALKEAYDVIADTQLELPDLVTAHIWSFAKPDLWISPDDN